MGGEKLLQFALPLLLTGSPPRGRGKVAHFQREFPIFRITPAWAGKRYKILRFVFVVRDHPRVGGEKPPPLEREALYLGSPPRGRGKGTSTTRLISSGRITPAWAGKRYFRGLSYFEKQDHPRVGGEKQQMPVRTDKRMGSPPRGRGKEIEQGEQLTRLGITPAWAGKSSSSLSRAAGPRDHPRVGGEKLLCAGLRGCFWGSPPRGRGKGTFSSPRRGPARITPAWAGKRLKRSHRSGIFISGPIPFHSVLHRPAGSGGSRAGRDGSPAGQPQNAGPA